MSTYARIEQRRAERQYVYYEFFRMSPEFDNAWRPTAAWCKYWITANNGVSRRQIFDEALIARDQYRSNNWQNIEMALNRIPGISKTTINHFKKLVSVNVRDDINCKLALYAGANIYDAALLEDISKCRSEADLSPILQRLSGQVYSAALNGAFAKLYTVVNLAIVNPPVDYTCVNKDIEDRITSYYNALMFGGKNSGCVDIPENPNGFTLPSEIYKVALEIEKQRDLPPHEIIKILDTSLKKTINHNSVIRTNGR